MAQQIGEDKPVLVIDDDEGCCILMAVRLKKKGYTVVTAQSGAVALQMLRAGLAPSLIVLDLSMPEMSGVQFRAEQLRDAALADIPVIVMTASEVDASTRDALGKIAGLFLKAVDTQALLKAIDLHCRKDLNDTRSGELGYCIKAGTKRKRP